MSKKMKRVMACAMCGLLTFGTMSFSADSSLVMVAEAHSGRTDSNGGHRDNKNKSGLGNYHYHCGGHEAHLHPNGVCPYNTASNAAQETPKAAELPQTETPSAPVTGWQQDVHGWWYTNADGSYLHDCFATLDSSQYYFNHDGYMLIGWQQIGDEWYYFDQNGHMVTGDIAINGTNHHFESDGCWNEDYYGDSHGSDHHHDYEH